MEKELILTTRQGHPARDNQNMRIISERGPVILEDYQFPEKVSHFDRGCVPERVFHARRRWHTLYLKVTARSATTPTNKFTQAEILQERENRCLYLFASQPLSMVTIHQNRRAIRDL